MAVEWEGEWLRMPWGSVIHRDDLGPCGDCGGTAFVSAVRMVEQEDRPPRKEGRTVCVGCVKLRRGERVVGHLDAGSGAYRKA
jgi:hypothetical protein